MELIVRDYPSRVLSIFFNQIIFGVLKVHIFFEKSPQMQVLIDASCRLLK